MESFKGDLLWSPAMQSLLLSATFYGGLATISFAGVLADRYGPKTIVIAFTLDYILVTLLTPFLARHSYVAYFTARVIMGIGEGFVFPSFASLIGKWYAPAEKSTVAAMYTSGNQVLRLPPDVYSLRFFGIDESKYFHDYTVMVSVGGWIFLIDFFIPLYIESRMADDILHIWCSWLLMSKLPVPWKLMLSSQPLIAAVFCQFTYNLQASLLQAFLPTFLKEELMLPLNKSIGSFGSAATLIALATLPNCENPYIALPLLGLYGQHLLFRRYMRLLHMYFVHSTALFWINHFDLNAIWNAWKYMRSYDARFDIKNG
ncbi:unnamed protein product [Strongylus vulgaris]|uniref:Major facilitator superfamily (MFS) profile domain-containing protein n=1 Tax=Strongylus vulgaris TaxID=40348 RepID=A0A3P7IVZ9_STRVU|nr:unnamed protein product [Strongylus vulgaris]